MSIATDRETASPREPIAVIGIGCRFPGNASSPEAFWNLIASGADAIAEVPPDRWNIDAFYDPDPARPGKMCSRWGGFVEGIDRFDAQFFGISPREAVHIDPQQRLLLEVAWEALEDAGCVPEKIGGSNAGVFVGISSHDYGDIQIKGMADAGGSGPYPSTGAALSIAANRVSYFFNLQGPSVAVDTACSSSLVAAHIGCQSLWRGECDVALVGGVNCLIAPETSIGFSKAGMLSPDGRCKAFDAAANGYVRGEGAGILVLKPLSKALAAGDAIYAVILATAVNQDGRTPGLTLPNRAAQEAILRDVYREARLHPDDVHYVEAHGTGTAAGDPIEATAIGNVLGRDRSADCALRIGSVKTNIGHLEAASGIAGMIKTVLMLKHRRIPPTVHFRNPNPAIAFEELHLQVPVALEAWPAGNARAVAGINSFGFGGTNGHVVLAEHRPESVRERRNSGLVSAPYLLPLSAKSPEALRATATAWSERLSSAVADEASFLHDVCFTAGARRSHHDHRLSVVVQSRDELVERLSAFLANESRAGLSSGRMAPAPRPTLAFLFSGMGPQWWGMGRELMETEPVFRDAVQKCSDLMGRHASWSLIDEMGADAAHSRMHETEIAQPANFALQVALAELWRSWGIVPDVIAGHSAGEVAAAHVAGALTLEAAVQVIFHRSRLQQRTSGQGRMLAVGLPAEEAAPFVAPYAVRVAVAAINSPSSITLAGDVKALEEIAQALVAQGAFARLLDGSVPFHSRHMDPLQRELLDCLADLRPNATAAPIYSTVTGAEAQGREFDANYWWRNVREPVLFSSAVRGLIGDGHTIFLELGPHPVLARAVVENLSAAGANGTVLASLRRDGPERAQLLGALGSLYTAGYPLDWTRLYPHGELCRSLPAYPWQKERFWHESEASAEFRFRPESHPLLARRLAGARPLWETDLDLHRFSYLRDHRLQDSIVYPAAAYVEMALAAGNAAFGGESCSVEDLELKKPLLLSDLGTTAVQFLFDPEEGAIDVYSRPQNSANSWSQHAAGRLVRSRSSAGKSVDLEKIRSAFTAETSQSDCYREFSRRGLHYGQGFQGIRRLWRGNDEALGEIGFAESAIGDTRSYLLHPSVLDSCFQVLIGAVGGREDRARRDGVYIPVRIDQVRFHGKPAPGELWTYAKLVERTAQTAVAEYMIIDTTGKLVAEVKGFRCRLVTPSRSGEADSLVDCLFEFQWCPQARRGLPPQTARFLPSPVTLARDVAAEITQLSQQLNTARHYGEVEVETNRLCQAYVVEALRQLEWPFSKGERFTLDSAAGQFRVLPAENRFFGRMLEILVEDGILKRRGEDYDVRKPLPATDAEQLRLRQLERYPEYAADLELLKRCGANLAAVLRGETEPLQLVFPDGSPALAERFYEGSPSLHLYNLIVKSVLSQACRRLPRGRAIRILEIGAGTGATTNRLLPSLPPRSTEYVYTDASSLFTTFGRDKFPAYPFIEYRLLDIEADPAAQGFDLHSFDVVLASYVLHATKDLRQTLIHARSLLAADGMLVVMEQIAPVRMIDLVFGCLSGWWRFEDLDVRQTRPWLTVDEWQRVLGDVGFTDVEPLSEAHAKYKPQQAVLLARNPHHQAVGAAPSTVSTAGVERERGLWVVFADDEGEGRELAGMLEERGEEVLTVCAADSNEEPCFGPNERLVIRPDNFDDMKTLMDSIGRERGCRGIVHLWSLDAAASDSAGVPDLKSAEARGPVALLHLVRALAKTDWPAPPRLYIATRGAQAASPQAEPVAVAQAPVWGIGRVINNEQTHLRCRLVDLDPAAPAGELCELFAELWVEDSEQEIAFRDSTRYVNRLVKVAAESLSSIQAKADASGQRPFSLQVARPGLLDSLAAVETKRRKPRSSEVEVRVEAASLNFRDVMKAMGMLPIEGNGDTPLGQECAGTVARVGSAVTEFRAGDAVVVSTTGSFSRYVTASVDDVFAKPSNIGMESASSVLAAFVTANYALIHLGRLQAGERVLIHSATGGVGLAAVQIARRAGAEIFATAGSPQKREFLKSIGIRHVMDSRSLDFADEVMRLTGGKGVDLVLNSLAGEFATKSIATLGKGGRFLEIGIVDIYRNSRLGLWPFKNGLSYFAIDLMQVHQSQPELIRRLSCEALRDIADGTLEALPARVFAVSDAANAFRYMAQAKHIGKIVVSFEDPALRIVPAKSTNALFRSDATYLITGGLGGFGLTVAEWMLEEGARHFVLAGRSGAASAEAQEGIRRIEDRGGRVLTAKVEITDSRQVDELWERMSAAMPPLRGVFHAAMVLDDGFLLQLDAARFTAVTAPKMIGAWNLHRKTEKAQLDYFVLFSSVAALLGSQGQANYVAANTFLDALAHYRHARKLPALTVDWGSLASVGYVARHGDVSQYLEAMGLQPFKPAEALAILGRLLRSNRCQVGVMRLNLEKLDISSPQLTAASRFSHLISKDARKQRTAAAQGSSMRAAVMAAGPEERRQLVEKLLRERLAKVLETSPSRLALDQRLADLGIDSLMAVELETVLEMELGVRMPRGALLDQDLTLARLVKQFLDQLGDQQGDRPGDPPGRESAPRAASVATAAPRPLQATGAGRVN